MIAMLFNPLATLFSPTKLRSLRVRATLPPTGHLGRLVPCAFKEHASAHSASVIFDAILSDLYLIFI